jgi:hypothetical protein
MRISLHHLAYTDEDQSHTILGSKSERGLTQLALDVLFRSIGRTIVHPAIALNQLAISDVSEGQLFTAAEYLDSVYGDGGESRAGSRAQTPMTVSTQSHNPAQPLPVPTPSWGSYKSLLGLSTILSSNRGKTSPKKESIVGIRSVNTFGRITRSVAKLKHGDLKEPTAIIYPTLPTGSSSSKRVPSLAAMPRKPTVDHITVPIEDDCEHAVVVSMYEVYNDKIFDLLADSGATTKTAAKRKQVLFKNTSWFHDRKVVTGLRKIVCGSLEEALLVLETGLLERRVTGTGSNAVSSRSHGFFCIDVKKRRKSGVHWVGNTLSIVDLAGELLAANREVSYLPFPGSERARTANTAGSTLAEAGKINESLMYLGQCMQIQSDISSGASDPSKIVPFRQCKLTELLFSNSFSTSSSSSQALQPRPQQQKAIMIVTADPRGDFNATSQILRYSALAREVTVPRIPSITSTILNTIKPSISMTNSTVPSSNTTVVSSTSTAPSALCTSCLSHGVEISTLISTLATERAAHTQELEELENRIRTECWDAFELQQERGRAAFAVAREEEQERLERHIDSKVDVLVRGLGAAQDAAVDPSSEVSNEELEEMRLKMQQVEMENSRLKEMVKVLEKEKEEKRKREGDATRTASRKIKVLKARPWNVDEAMGIENE